MLLLNIKSQEEYSRENPKLNIQYPCVCRVCVCVLCVGGRVNANATMYVENC